MIIKSRQKTLTNYSMGMEEIPTDEMFSKEEVRFMINIKANEIEAICSEEIDTNVKAIKDRMKSKNEDFKISKDQGKLVLEYLEILREDCCFGNFAQI